MKRLCICLSLAGCVQVAPNLKMPEKSCPRLAMPAIPDDVVLDIKGDKITANTGGELILRAYARARTLLK